METKIPPHNTDAEEALLGGLLIDGSYIEVLNLDDKDFYYEQNQTIYRAMLQLKDKRIALNPVTVAQELTEMGMLEEVGGAAKMPYLVSICPTSLDCPDYAEIVKRLSFHRSLITAGDRLSATGYEAEGDIEDKLKRADNLLLKLREQAGIKNIITPKDRMDRLWDRYAGLYQAEKGIALSTGLIDLDRILGGGLYPTDLIIVAARTSMGKTSFLQTIGNHVGKTGNVLFCSGEMDVEGLSDRDVAGLVGVSIDAVRLGHYNDELYQAIVDNALPYMNELKIFHLDASHRFKLTIDNIYQTAYDIQLRHGLALIVIDYLNLITDRYGSNQNERLGYISQNLKMMAKSLNIPVLCAHQLSRAVESREEKRPQLHDLRESGHIEEDADVVLFLYRESYYNEEANDVMEVLVGKKRQGQSGRGVKILWDKKHLTYRNLEKKQKQEQMI